jgi:hypothetical protein
MREGVRYISPLVLEVGKYDPATRAKERPLKQLALEKL